MSSVVCQNPTLNSPLNRAAKDKFILILNLPKILRERSSENELLNIDAIQFSVFGTIVPTISIPAIEVRFGGQSTNFSSHSRPNYQPLTLSFVVDNKFQNYYVLWKWLEILNTPLESEYGGTPLDKMSNKSQHESGLLNEYEANFSIICLDEYNEKVVEFKYLFAFPTNLGAINYSYRDSELIETTVEFQFSQLDISYVTKK